jgi:hypothetical protein
MREPKLGERIKITGHPEDFKIESIFFDQVTAVEIKRGRGERKKLEINISDITYLEAETLARDKMFEVLGLYVEESFLKENLVKEIGVFGRLRQKYPDLSFWKTYFRPKFKVKSLLWWLGGGSRDLEIAYKNYTLDLTQEQKKITLSDNKVVEEVRYEKKPKNLFDILT